MPLQMKQNLPVILGGAFIIFAIWFFSGSEDELEKREPLRKSIAKLEAEPEFTIAPQPSMDLRKGAFSSEKPLFDQLVDAGLSPQIVQRLVTSLQEDVDFRRVREGVEWELTLFDEVPCQFTLNLSPIDIYDVFDLSVKPVVAKRNIAVSTEIRYYKGELQTSLFEAFSHMPKGIVLAVKVADVFAWDIDFYQDPRKGDQFEFMVETAFVEREGKKEFLEYRRILSGRYFGEKGKFNAFLFEDEKGKDAYYNAEGRSLVRDVLRSPLKLVRITSSFKGQRFHPVLKKKRAHNGVDYGAPKNTPVMAVADGVIEHAGWYGNAGKAVLIRHKGKMLTQYFHLNQIPKGIRKGKRIRQGRTIGYVGKTGLATGYHLHFGMKIRGKYVNPQRQKFQPGAPIPKNRMPDFIARMKEYEDMTVSFKEPIQMALLKPASP